jgi:multidrug resistance protein
MTRRLSSGAALPAVCSALFVDSLLYSIVVPILPAYAKHLGTSTAAIGVLFAAYAIGLLATTVPLGTLSDRVGRRLPMLVGSAGVIVSTLAFAFATSYPLLVTARFVQGVAAAAVWTAGIALIADHVPAQRHGRAMGTAMAFMSAGLIAGPPIGGFLVHFGHRVPFLVAAVAAGVNGVFQFVVVRDSHDRASATRTIRQLLGERRLVLVVSAVALAAAALSMLEPIMPLVLTGRFAVGAALIGVLFGAATLANGVSSPAAGALADRLPRPLLLAAGLVIMGITMPFLAVPKSLVTVTALMIGFAIANSFVIVPALPELARVADSHGGSVYATTYATFNIAYGVGMVAGPVGGGFVASHLSATTAFACLGVLLVGGGFLIAVLTSCRLA